MSTIQRCHKYFQFPLAIIVFNRILLYVDDPETMEIILTAPECLNKTFLQNGFYANKGLLHAKDEEWKIRRKQLNPAFSHNTLVSFFGVFNRVANELKQKIFKDLKGSQVKFKSLEDLVTRAVLQVSCVTTMGFETNFMQKDEKFIAQSFRYLMELTALRILRPWYQIDIIFRLLDKENYEKSKRANKLVKEFVANIVKQKHIEWLHKHTHLNQNLDITTTINCDPKSITSKAKDEISFTKEHRSTGGNDALKNIIGENSFLPDPNANAFMQQQEQQQQQQQRIFIEQIFYLAQTGKLTLEDIMNESQSMVVVSFETVSSCIINALLCLAINHECQMKLRHEIRQILSMSKEINSITKTTAKTSIKHTKDTEANAVKSNENCTNTIENENDWDFDATVADGKSDMNNVRMTKEHNDTHDNDNDDDDNGNDADDVGNVTMEHLLNMPYLDMIINESLRLLTTIPMNLRNVSTDFQLNIKQRDKCYCITKTNNTTNNSNVSGKYNNSCCNCNSDHSRSVVVPKDTMIALDTFNMQRNERYWGENSLKFYPEHFEKKQQQQKRQQHKENKTKVEKNETPLLSSITTTKTIQTSSTEVTTSTSNRHSYAFIPFSKGLRTCIGYRYSIYLSKIMLIKLISSFEFSTNIELKDLEYYESISLKFRNAENIQFEVKPIGCVNKKSEQ
ncbi:cytochrome P450 318a1 isoform 2-T2 [Cochliomyia hominivorax]